MMPSASDRASRHTAGLVTIVAGIWFTSIIVRYACAAESVHRSSAARNPATQATFDGMTSAAGLRRYHGRREGGARWCLAAGKDRHSIACGGAAVAGGWRTSAARGRRRRLPRSRPAPRQAHPQRILARCRRLPRQSVPQQVPPRQTTAVRGHRRLWYLIATQRSIDRGCAAQCESATECPSFLALACAAQPAPARVRVHRGLHERAAPATAADVRRYAYTWQAPVLG